MGGPPAPCLALLRVGFTSRQVALVAGALLPHRFTLACALGEPNAIGGLFSVALSCGSPRLTHASTLPYGAPTFLNASPRRGHLADSPPTPSMHAINLVCTANRQHQSDDGRGVTDRMMLIKSCVATMTGMRGWSTRPQKQSSGMSAVDRFAGPSTW